MQKPEDTTQPATPQPATPQPATPQEEKPQSSRPRILGIIAAIAKPLGCITRGVGLGFLIVMFILCWLLFVVAPQALESTANVFGS